MKTPDRQFDDLVQAVLQPPPRQLSGRPMACADFFCGIGGFHIAAVNVGMEVVCACDIDLYAREAYFRNFGLKPFGDIVRLSADQVPDHDVLCAGFPCQPFSIIGRRQAFSDPRGALFFEILKFVRIKRPRAVVLENVKQLATVDGGRVLQRIRDGLEKLRYAVDFRVLNALDFGLPQKRERTIIVALQSHQPYQWPEETISPRPLSEILETNPDSSYFVSDTIRRKRHASHIAEGSPRIWHENKGGNISSHPWSCALRAGASHNYLLVDGERRLTPREMLRLQGFPESWKIVCSPAQTRKQAGNAVPVPIVEAVLRNVVRNLAATETARPQAPTQ